MTGEAWVRIDRDAYTKARASRRDSRVKGFEDRLAGLLAASEDMPVEQRDRLVETLRSALAHLYTVNHGGRA